MSVLSILSEFVICSGFILPEICSCLTVPISNFLKNMGSLLFLFIFSNNYFKQLVNYSRLILSKTEKLVENNGGMPIQ
jgi:hypothetical protein